MKLRAIVAFVPVCVKAYACGYFRALHGNGNACAIPRGCSACEISELNADSLSGPHPPHPAAKNQFILLQSSIYTFFSYEIPPVVGGRFIRWYESSDGFVIQIESRCVTKFECNLTNGAITRTSIVFVDLLTRCSLLNLAE